MLERLRRRNEKKLYGNKVSLLIDNIVSNGDSVIEEAVAIACSIFPESEISVYDSESATLLGTTTYNQDIKTEIAFVLSTYGALQEPIAVKKNERKKIRENVSEMHLFPLFFEEKKVGLLCVEAYEEFSMPEKEELYDVLKLFSITVWSKLQREKKARLLELDQATLLPTRDTLLEHMKELVTDGVQDKSFGLICLSNLAQLNKSMGLHEVDYLIKRVSDEICALRKSHVYRLGGAKFAFLFQNDLYNAAHTMERIVDGIMKTDKRIVTKNIVTPLREGAYETIYVAESYLKCAKEDVISIVRESCSEADIPRYQKVSEVYMEEDVRPAPEPEPKKYYDVEMELVSEKTVLEEHEELLPNAENKDTAEQEVHVEENEPGETEYYYDMFKELMEEE